MNYIDFSNCSLLCSLLQRSFSKGTQKMTLLNILLRQHLILKEVWKILCWRERLKGYYYLIFLSINKKIFITLETIEKHNLSSIAIGIKINVIIWSKVFSGGFFSFLNINFLFNNLLIYILIFNYKNKLGKYNPNWVFTSSFTSLLNIDLLIFP